MLITGIKLREALKRWELIRDMAVTQFNDSLHVFEGETKDNPIDIMNVFSTADINIAKLQVAQEEYNINVKVTLSSGEVITLGEAIKRVGGAGRIEKMWRTTVNKNVDRWDRSASLTRSKDDEVAKQVISPADGKNLILLAARVAGNLRSVIAEGNSKEVDINWLTQDLFE